MNEIEARGAMDSEEMRRRISGATVARLATVGPEGRPHIVPITFALDDDTIYFAVDFKPKKTADLQRLRNIEANPAVSVLVDHYEEDWTKLWWVRADGSARVVIDGAVFEKAIALLSQRYAQYRSARPAGPVVPIAIEGMTGWSAS
jgi:PPOX class probable F420-dependent enzyme